MYNSNHVQKNKTLQDLINYSEDLRKFAKTMADAKIHDYQYYLGRMQAAEMIRDHGRLLKRANNNDGFYVHIPGKGRKKQTRFAGKKWSK